ARIARRLVDLSSNSIGMMGTVFPSDHPTLAGQPFTLQEYYASCHWNGSMTLLFLPISRHSQNILRSSNRTASISVSSESPAARSARVSLIGTVTVFDQVKSVPDVAHLQQCYLDKHPDAKWWLPDDDEAAHISYWAMFHPHTVYFVGGFGDKHYIGFIPLNLYQSATPDVYQAATPERGVAGRILIEQSIY
ncbi:hypothetical protein AMATHDRAFT_136815, partial [Amanita thiersii Skay4041]